MKRLVLVEKISHLPQSTTNIEINQNNLKNTFDRQKVP